MSKVPPAADSLAAYIDALLTPSSDGAAHADRAASEASGNSHLLKFQLVRAAGVLFALPADELISPVPQSLHPDCNAGLRPLHEACSAGRAGREPSPAGHDMARAGREPSPAGHYMARAGSRLSPAARGATRAGPTSLKTGSNAARAEEPSVIDTSQPGGAKVIDLAVVALGRPAATSAPIILALRSDPARVLAVDALEGVVEAHAERVTWRGGRGTRPWLAGMLDEPRAAVVSIPHLDEEA